MLDLVQSALYTVVVWMLQYTVTPLLAWLSGWITFITNPLVMIGFSTAFVGWVFDTIAVILPSEARDVVSRVVRVPVRSVLSSAHRCRAVVRSLLDYSVGAGLGFVLVHGCVVRGDLATPGVADLGGGLERAIT